MDDGGVEMRAIYKSFGSIEALNGMDFTARPGEITALVGDNGSGKSTLMKILSGCIVPDAGSLLIAGQLFSRLTTAQAISLGIDTVYQDLALDDFKDCAENIFLGRELMKWGLFLDKRRMAAEAAELLQQLGADIPDLSVAAAHLSGGQRQVVALARAMASTGCIKIFDEPAAALGPKQTKRVLRLLGNLRRNGRAVILISHDLFQVFEIADRICVMEHGRAVADLRSGDSSPQELYDLMAGREACR